MFKIKIAEHKKKLLNILRYFASNLLTFLGKNVMLDLSLNKVSSVNGACSFKETASVEQAFTPNEAALLSEGPS